MKRIINFCKEKYKILIPAMVGCVLLITLFFLYNEYKYDNTRNKKDVSVYQYINGFRNDFTATVTYNLRDAIVDVKPKEVLVRLNSIPLYYQEEEKAIFPEEMTVVFPSQNCSQYKTYKYATYYKEDDLYFVKNNTKLDYYNNFFLYDGDDVFFFPYETILKINDKEYKKLGEMSYVAVVGGLTLVYYDTATETSEFIELEGDTVSVVNEDLYLDVNINRATCKSFGRDILLFEPDNLIPLSKTIDK